MDYVQLINEVKMSSNSEVQSIATSYGIQLSTTEINELRLLVDEISLHWIFTGVPEAFISKVRMAIGDQKTEQLLQLYVDATS